MLKIRAQSIFSIRLCLKKKSKNLFLFSIFFLLISFFSPYSFAFNSKNWSLQFSHTLLRNIYKASKLHAHHSFQYIYIKQNSFKRSSLLKKPSILNTKQSYFKNFKVNLIINFLHTFSKYTPVPDFYGFKNISLKIYLPLNPSFHWVLGLNTSLSAHVFNNYHLLSIYSGIVYRFLTENMLLEFTNIVSGHIYKYKFVSNISDQSVLSLTKIVTMTNHLKIFSIVSSFYLNSYISRTFSLLSAQRLEVRLIFPLKIRSFQTNLFTNYVWKSHSKDILYKRNPWNINHVGWMIGLYWKI